MQLYVYQFFFDYCPSLYGATKFFPNIETPEVVKESFVLSFKTIYNKKKEVIIFRQNRKNPIFGPKITVFAHNGAITIFQKSRAVIF